MQDMLQNYPNLTILSGSVHDLIIKHENLNPDIASGNIGAEVGGVTLGEYSLQNCRYQHNS
jgi:hypothetical protein